MSYKEKNEAQNTVQRGVVESLYSAIALCKEIQGNFGFWTPRRGFQIPGTGFPVFVSGT